MPSLGASILGSTPGTTPDSARRPRDRASPFQTARSQSASTHPATTAADGKPTSGNNPELEPHSPLETRSDSRLELGLTGPGSAAASSSATATEYTTPTATKFIFLILYFSLNLSLTLSNKSVLNAFPYPWMLTAFHATSASLGTTALLLLTRFGPRFGIHFFQRSRYLSFALSPLKSRRSHLVLLAFSVLFTLNIALSNISLSRVSLPFHQTLRSTTPIFTVILFRLLYSRTYSRLTYYSLIPLICGPVLATYGDYYFSLLGFVLTLFGVISASVKTIVTYKIMTGTLALPAIELLFRMAPLAAVQSLVWAAATGELSAFTSAISADHTAPDPGSDPSHPASPSTASSYSAPTLVILLLANSLIAFFLNIVSFQTNKLAGPLTMSVCGNIKQVLTIVLGIVVFHVRVGFLNGLGMVITLLGAGWYSKVELDNKSCQKKQTEHRAETLGVTGSSRVDESQAPLLPLHNHIPNHPGKNS